MGDPIKPNYTPEELEEKTKKERMFLEANKKRLSVSRS